MEISEVLRLGCLNAVSRGKHSVGKICHTCSPRSKVIECVPNVFISVYCWWPEG